LIRLGFFVSCRPAEVQPADVLAIIKVLPNPAVTAEHIRVIVTQIHNHFLRALGGSVFGRRQHGRPSVHQQKGANGCVLKLFS
jgi:hypothetical protein